MRQIVICGPESTGKSSLATHLTQSFGGIYIPEYARDYVEHLEHSYTYKDVEYIARYQIEQERRMRELYGPTDQWLFFDTWLIITKVWFDYVYHKVPQWLEQKIENHQVDLFLLCFPDLPWEPDPVRENPHIRMELFERYKVEIEKTGTPVFVVSGSDQERYQKAEDFLRNFL